MEGTPRAAGYQMQVLGAAPARPPRGGQWGAGRGAGVGRGPSRRGSARLFPGQPRPKLRRLGGSAARPPPRQPRPGKRGGRGTLRPRSHSQSNLPGRPGEGTAELVWSLHSQYLSTACPFARGNAAGAQAGPRRWAKAASNGLASSKWLRAQRRGGRRDHCRPSSREDRCDSAEVPARQSASESLLEKRVKGRGRKGRTEKKSKFWVW